MSKEKINDLVDLTLHQINLLQETIFKIERELEELKKSEKNDECLDLELVSASIGVCNNADPQCTVGGFCAIELPKIERLRAALERKQQL